MIRRTRKALNGRMILELVPENPRDIQKLRRLEKAGKVDARHSFGDDPAVWGFDPQDTRRL